MQFISNWANCILIAIIFAGIIEIIVPEGETKKFVLLVTGIFVSIVVSMPIIKLFSKDFELKDIFAVETIENNFYYVDTLRNTVDKQKEILENVFADSIVKEFNKKYIDMKIDECKIVFSHDRDGKIKEIKEVNVKIKDKILDKQLLKKRVAEICEVDVKKVEVS